MPSATIKLFLPRGDARGLRTAEISNWNGKAIAAPRTEFDDLLARPELDRAGVYLLLGSDPARNAPKAYVGEAEVLRERLKQHRAREYWVSAIAFTSKDETLTKAHVRHLEHQILAEAAAIGRYQLDQNHASGARLPESDREDMRVFLERIRQLLPVLGTDLLVPIAPSAADGTGAEPLVCRTRMIEASGQRSPAGFVVYKGSTAVPDLRPSAPAWIAELRERLLAEGALVVAGPVLKFARDLEFSSPSTAASVVRGGSANGLVEWRTRSGVTLRQLEEQG